MTRTAINQASIAIEAADLPAPVYRTARRLLDIAAQQNGNVVLDRDRMRSICGNAADGTMRNHLIKLAQVGIIAYHTNHFVTVRFLAWQEDNVRPEAETLHAHRADLHDGRSYLHASHAEPTEPLHAHRANLHDSRSRCTHSVQKSASEVQIRAQGVQNTPPLVVCLVDQPIETDIQTNNHGAPIEDAGSPNINANDRQKSFKMLTDPEIGISPRRAADLAATIPTAEILRQIAAWFPRQKAGNQGPGMLIKRLIDRWGAQEPSAEFRRGEFYRRHFPDAPSPYDDDASWQNATYAESEEFDEIPPMPMPPSAKATTPPGPWQEYLTQLNLSNPGMADYFTDSELIHVGERDGKQHYQVSITDERNVIWLTSQLGYHIRRTLAVILRQPNITVEIVATESGSRE